MTVYWQRFCSVRCRQAAYWRRRLGVPRGTTEA
jgi:hypothetical protein